MTAMRASHPKARCSDGVMSPQVCDRMVVIRKNSIIELGDELVQAQRCVTA